MGSINAINEEVNGLKEAAVQHQIRLEESDKIFTDYDNRIKEIEFRTSRRPVSKIKVAGLMVTILVVCFSSIWGLANMLRDRPTIGQVDRSIDKHDANGHKSAWDFLHAVQVEQASQRVIIEVIKNEQLKQGEKLDRLIEWTDPRKH